MFIHDALVELITCGDTSVPASELRKHIKKMSQKEGDGSGFTLQLRVRQNAVFVIPDHIVVFHTPVSAAVGQSEPETF